YVRCIFCAVRVAPLALLARSLHDALPICGLRASGGDHGGMRARDEPWALDVGRRRCAGETNPADEGGSARQYRRLHGACGRAFRSEEHTSELQSRENLVCRLLLEKKNI